MLPCTTQQSVIILLLLVSVIVCSAEADRPAHNPDKDPTVGALHKATSWYDAHGPVSVHSRPRSLEDGRTNMSYMVEMVQLLGLDVKSQMLTGKFWESYKWHDPRIEWDPAEYDNVTHINIPHGENIWGPDILLFNEFENKRSSDSFYDIIHNNGEIMWVPATIYTVPCSMDMTKFPFDSHTCDLTFGSWRLSTEELDLQLDASITVGRPTLVENSEWETVHQHREIVDTAYPIGNWTLVHYRMTFRRRAGFFAYVLVLPAILMNFLTLVLFILPPECEDKVNLGMSLFLSYFVLLMIVVESTPKSGLSIPIIGHYLFVSLGLIATSIFVCTILYNMSHKHAEPRDSFSPMTMKILRIMDKALCTRHLVLNRKTNNDVTDHRNSSSVVQQADLENENDRRINTAPSDQWRLVASICQRLILFSFICFNVIVLILMIRVFLQCEATVHTAC